MIERPGGALPPFLGQWTRLTPHPMIPTTSKYLATAICLAALAVLALAWWANGAEREDSWLYVSSGIVALSGALASWPWRKGEGK
jgi:hypothetical protein